MLQFWPTTCPCAFKMKAITGKIMASPTGLHELAITF